MKKHKAEVKKKPVAHKKPIDQKSPTAHKKSVAQKSSVTHKKPVVDKKKIVAKTRIKNKPVKHEGKLVKPKKRFSPFAPIKKIVGKVKLFFGNLNKKISQNRLLANPYFGRITIIAFFFGLNIVLGAYFIKNNKVHLPGEVVDVINESGVIEVLKETGFVEEEELSFLGEELAKDIEASLEPQVILKLLNKERVSFKVSELDHNESLASAAAILLNEAKKYDYDLDKKDFLPDFKNALDEVGYNYLHVSHNIVIGPLLEQAVVDAWFSDNKQIEALKDDDFVEVGFATTVADLEGIGVVGVVVQVLGKPMITPKIPVPVNDVVSNQNFPEVSDQEVFDALNSYRKSHDVSSLKINDNLCSYASKRVGDLIIRGGLDDHEGFKKDFEDQENLPEVIQYYSGNSVAENLAFQNCKNMTTGDSFVAETGTALIEWCFDSSTEGHREAQLNRKYKNGCVRHAESMYVIIFGN